VQQAFGFGLTLDYYQSGPWLKGPDGSWTHWAFTGTGLPMRLVDEEGQLLGIRQLTTTMADEQLIAGAYDGWEGLNADGAIDVSHDVLERASRWHGAPVLQFHLDFLEPDHPVRSTVTQWLKQSLEMARGLRMPIWSPAMFLTSERCREQTRIAAWTGHHPGSCVFASTRPTNTRAVCRSSGRGRSMRTRTRASRLRSIETSAQSCRWDAHSS
jgi:hypothetical protein